jgi:hypothetical protein
VRENRTPGSVRGLLGNWQSYRDQLFSDAADRNAQCLATRAESALNLPLTSIREHCHKRLGVQRGNRGSPHWTIFATCFWKPTEEMLVLAATSLKATSRLKRTSARVSAFAGENIKQNITTGAQAKHAYGQMNRYTQTDLPEDSGRSRI